MFFKVNLNKLEQGPMHENVTQSCIGGQVISSRIFIAMN